MSLYDERWRAVCLASPVYRAALEDEQGATVEMAHWRLLAEQYIHRLDPLALAVAVGQGVDFQKVQHTAVFRTAVADALRKRAEKQKRER